MTDKINPPPRYEKHIITFNPADVLLDLPYAVGRAFEYIIRAEDKGGDLENFKCAWIYFQAAKNKNLLGFKEILGLAMFKYSDIRLLREQAQSVKFTCDEEEAWDLFEGALERRISTIERQLKKKQEGASE